MVFVFTGLMLSESCGSSKGYRGTKLESSELARIYQRDRKLRIGGRKTLEAALLIKIDTISVGSYMKGFPKYTDMLPGAKTVEIRHFQGWKDKSAMAGLLFGIIEASIAESNNLHTHHKLIFPTKPRKHLDFL